MKIKTDQLAKAHLVTIIDAMRGGTIALEPLIVKAYQVTLTDQLNAIQRQIAAIDKKLEDKKLSRKAYATLVKKYKQLGRLGNKKLKSLKELDLEE